MARASEVVTLPMEKVWRLSEDIRTGRSCSNISLVNFSAASKVSSLHDDEDEVENNYK
jgi:hypothetical protein